jgi:hypothetical protein
MIRAGNLGWRSDISKISELLQDFRIQKAQIFSGTFEGDY